MSAGRKDIVLGPVHAKCAANDDQWKCQTPNNRYKFSKTTLNECISDMQKYKPLDLTYFRLLDVIFGQTYAQMQRSPHIFDKW